MLRLSTIVQSNARRFRIRGCSAPALSRHLLCVRALVMITDFCRKERRSGKARRLKSTMHNRSSTGASRWRRPEGEWFRLSNSCELALHIGDITEWHVDRETDVIVNSANERMLGGGGVDGAIHKAAGPKLEDACAEFPTVAPGVRCPVGTALLTKGFELPASRVIHTVGPIYETEEASENLLADAYRYPVDEAATVALETVKENASGLSEIHFVLFQERTYNAWLSRACKLFRQSSTS